MKKFILSSFMMLTLMLCFVFGVSAIEESGSLGNNVTYTYDSETGTVVISGEGDMKDYHRSTYTTSPFYKSEIKNVVIEDGVTSIGDFVFYYCNSLTSISIPDCVVSIGDEAFSSCESLVTITIPDSVTSMGYGVFDSCKSLETITIPDSVTSMSYRIFDGCSNLTKITVDENNKYYSSDEDGALYNKTKTTLIKFPEGNKKSEYIVPDSVTAIEGGAFQSCYRLEYIKLSDNLVSLGDDVFLDCISLKNLTIPESVISIEECLTYNCYSLEELYILNKDLEEMSMVRALPYCWPNPDETKISRDDFVELIISNLDKGKNWLSEEVLSFCIDYDDGLPNYNTTIYGYTGSTAESYAKEYGFDFEAITDDITVTDEKTNITAEYTVGIFDGIPDMIITEGGANANITLGGLFGKFTSFDITFEIDDKEVQPMGKVTIKIPLPAGYNSRTTKVYYIDDLGRKTVLESTYADGYVIFETDHFSEYVLVDESSAIENEPTEDDKTDDCTCMCHKGGFMKFIYKIMRFFWKLFKTNAVCGCGVTHY